MDASSKLKLKEILADYGPPTFEYFGEGEFSLKGIQQKNKCFFGIQQSSNGDITLAIVPFLVKGISFSSDMLDKPIYFEGYSNGSKILIGQSNFGIAMAFFPIFYIVYSVTDFEFENELINSIEEIDFGLTNFLFSG